MIRLLQIMPSMAISYGGPSHALSQMQLVFRERSVSSTIVTVFDPINGELTLPAAPDLLLFPGRFSPIPFCSMPLLAWLKENIRRFDLVHIHSLFTFPTLAAGYYARRHKIPYMIRPFGTLDKHCMKRHFLRKKIYFELFERNNLNKASIIHCTSLSEKEELSRFRLKAKSVVVPLGVKIPDTFLPKDSGTTEKKTGIKQILFLSRIDPKKGLEVLIQALELLIVKRKDFCLWIAGSGNDAYVTRIKNKVIQYGLKDKVLFIGEVSGDKKREVLESADIFLLPSYRENFGLAVAEAMASGCPVIVSDQVAIHKDITEFGAGLVVSVTPEAISGALDQLLCDGNMRHAMGKKGQQLVKERFDLEINVEKLIGVYKKIILGRKTA